MEPSAALLGDDGDTALFHGLLDRVPDSTLIDAARRMEGVEFFHGGRQELVTFKYEHVEAEVQNALAWAKNPMSRAKKGKSLAKELGHVGIERLAALRCWTGTSLCYSLTSLLRKANRTRADLEPVLPYAKLLIGGLRGLPERFVKKGTIYRGEQGVSDRWDEKMGVGRLIQWFAPLSFSQNPAVLRNFMSSRGPRTMFTLEGACGYDLREISIFQDGEQGEDEVLVECVSRAKVLKAEHYDDDHPEVMAGQVESGLHTATLRMCPGINMLTSTRSWVAEELMADQADFNGKVFNIVVRGGMDGDRVALSCLSTGKVDLWKVDDGSGRQRWRFVHVPGTSDVYQIHVSGGTEERARMLSCTADGKMVDLFHSDDGSNRQRWRITLAEDTGIDKWYNIEVAGGVPVDLRYLSVPSTGDSAELWHSSGLRQQWKLIQKG